MALQLAACPARQPRRVIRGLRLPSRGDRDGIRDDGHSGGSACLVRGETSMKRPPANPWPAPELVQVNGGGRCISCKREFQGWAIKWPDAKALVCMTCSERHYKMLAEVARARVARPSGWQVAAAWWLGWLVRFRGLR